MGRGNIVGMNKQGENALEILALKNTKYIFKPTVINNVVSLKAYHKDKQNSCRIYAGSPGMYKSPYIMKETSQAKKLMILF